MSLINELNYYKNPEAKDHLHLVTDEDGNIFAFVRTVEAWDKWAEINGYDNRGDFMEERDWYPEHHSEKTQIVWHDAGRLGTLEGGGTIRVVDIQGFYRDGKSNL